MRFKDHFPAMIWTAGFGACSLGVRHVGSDDFRAFPFSQQTLSH